MLVVLNPQKAILKVSVGRVQNLLLDKFSGTPVRYYLYVVIFEQV